MIRFDACFLRHARIRIEYSASHTFFHNRFFAGFESMLLAFAAIFDWFWVDASSFCGDFWLNFAFWLIYDCFLGEDCTPRAFSSDMIYDTILYVFIWYGIRYDHALKRIYDIYDIWYDMIWYMIEMIYDIWYIIIYDMIYDTVWCMLLAPRANQNWI